MTHFHPFSLSGPALLAIAVAILAMLTPQAMAQSASAARSRVMSANNMLEAGRFDDVEPSLQEAEKFLQGLPDAEKAPVVKEIADLRAKVEPARKAAKAKVLKTRIERDIRQAEDDAANNPEGAASSLKSVATRLDSSEVTSSMDPADIASLKSRLADAQKKAGGSAAKPAAIGNASSARSSLMWAKDALDSRNFERAEQSLRDAEQAMAGLPDSEKAPLLKELADVRDLFAAGKNAEKLRDVEDRLDRDIGTASGNAQNDPLFSDACIKSAESLLASDEAKGLDASKVANFRARLTDAKAKVAAENKSRALDRANGLLNKVDDAMSADPFAGKDDFDAYKISRELESNLRGTRAWLADIPQDDPDVRAANDKAAALRMKIDAATSSWSKARVEATVTAGWKFNIQNVEGWEQEKPNAGDKPNEWMMPKTAAALRNAAYWLNDDQIKKLRAENPDSAVVKATIAEAERTHDTAASRLNDAFNAAMAQAEKWPTPMGEKRFDRVIASWMASDADQVFKDTKYQQPNVARAKALDAKWEQEIQTKLKAQAELRKKLSAEGDAAWPAIASSAGARANFDAHSLSKGDKILLKRIYCRAGWDFDGLQYEFALRVNGVAIAGTYDKTVNDAIKQAWTKLDGPPLDDHEPWDVIAIVEGPATIRRRVKTDIIAEDTREVILKLDGFQDEPGIKVKVIALHAGPVTAGPK